ncbi:oxidoreductase [Thermocatellispora tengchongensis]|uniref:oxidoreductase n=1 Tax=Thermocatellispora tengchongensis TaxID=1073253 RepID=UPI003639BD3D
MPNDSIDPAERGGVTAPAGLLSPYSAGRLSLPNRVAFTATINNLGRNRDITPEQIAFYEARARGGAGLIITEGLSVHPTSIPGYSVPLAYEPDNIPRFRRLAEAVHRHGTPILGQLWHIGRQALHTPLLKPWSASGTRDPYSGMTPHAMDEEEIHELIDGFARSAAHLAEAGFDGVEIHGAHGYVITQFLSPSSNFRDDRWGGSTENRSRFVMEVLRAIRDRCGEDFVVGLKISAHEYVDGGLDLAESQRIVALLAREARPDFLAVSQANASPSLEYHVPDLAFGPAPFAHLAAGVREVADGIPVMALAKVPDLETGQRLVDEGVADLIGMSRAWLAEPDLVAKRRAGQTPRPCTYCNVCWEFIHTAREIVCIYAPGTGREAAHREPVRAAVPRTVRVVGGGLAGLEAARSAAAGGHTVHLYERDERLGGRIGWEATVTGREEMALAPGWLTDEVTKAGVEIHLGTEVTEEVVAGWHPHDVVVPGDRRQAGGPAGPRRGGDPVHGGRVAAAGDPVGPHRGGGRRAGGAAVRADHGPGRRRA